MHVLLLSTPMNIFVQRGSLLDLGLRFVPMMSTLTAHKFAAGAQNKSAKHTCELRCLNLDLISNSDL